MHINESLQTAIGHFLSTVPIKRLKQGIRKQLLTNLQSEATAGLSIHMPDYWADLDELFDLLDVMEEETDQSGIA